MISLIVSSAIWFNINCDSLLLLSINIPCDVKHARKYDDPNDDDDDDDDDDDGSDDDDNNDDSDSDDGWDNVDDDDDDDDDGPAVNTIRWASMIVLPHFILISVNIFCSFNIYSDLNKSCECPRSSRFRIWSSFNNNNDDVDDDDIYRLWLR